MIKSMLLSVVAMSAALGAVACGSNPCFDDYTRIKAKYDDCRIDIPSTVVAYSEDSECTDNQADSTKALADAVEDGTCDNLRALSGQN